MADINQSTSEGHWKHLPPYEGPSDEQFGLLKWRGKCFCGKITYLLKREKPLIAKYCHCRVCQVTHGAPLQWAAIFHKDDIAFPNGVSGLRFYSSTHNRPDHVLPTKVSCANCRTPIMDEGRNMCLIFPQLIELAGSSLEQREKTEAFKPTCHIFYQSRTLDLPDGLPKWSGMENASDRMDDHGHRIGVEQ
ncbi:Glutathione-dependent formaldehyde-activating enzyme/centromere protein V [Penicillium digitatum]|uniref:Glutathione-dependent formaldehyde-activating enzyme/centromere protein V n=1 Tax=Penicillium digitatum TaxID=36651 RepID=A0A7T7BL82_PENDI|nr:Glutathione-dependent formaldehyde-activating enzyme/centromere protein V [Penicillium digitatum]